MDAATLEEKELAPSLSTIVNMVILGTETSTKHRFIASIVGQNLGTSPGVVPMKRVFQLEKESYLVNIDTNICSFDSINHQCFRRGQGFLYVYNTSSRESLEMFTAFRERVMRVKEVETRLPMMIVALVPPRGNRLVATMEGKQLSEYFSCLFREVRMEDTVQMDECMLELLKDIRTHEAGYVNKASRPELDENDETEDTSALGEYGIGVVGDCFVGKTALIRKLTSNTYYSRYIATEEDKLQKFRMVIENERCILRINDTPGLHAGENWTKESLVPMQGFLLVYSVTSKESFDKITELREKIASCKTETKVPFVLVGNKCEDVLNRQITTSMGFQLAKMLDIPFFETSAKEKDVQECFSVLVKKVKSIFQSVPTVELGEMHKSGILEKQRGKKWHKRLFVLREGSLTYHHVEGTKSMAQRGGLCFDSSTRLEIGDFDPKVGFIFSITFSGEKYTLAAATAEERASWMVTARLNIAIAEVGESLVEETIRPVLFQLMSTVPPANDKPRKSRSLSSMRRGDELTPPSPHHDGENTSPSSPSSPAFSPKQTGRWTSAGAPVAAGGSEGDSSFHCNNNSEGERQGGECTEASEAGEETPSRASVYGGLAASPTGGGGGGSNYNRHTTPPPKTAAAAGGRPTPPPRPSFMKELAEAQSRKLKHKHNSVGVPADLSFHSHTQHFITANNNYATATTVELHHSSPSVSPVGGTGGSGGSLPRRKSGGLLRKKHSIARWFEAEDSPSSSPLSSSSSAGGEGHFHPAASTDTLGSPPPAGISGSGAGFALRPSSLADELGQGAKKQAKKQAKLLRKEFKKKERQEKLKRAHSQRTLTDSPSQT